MAYEAQNAKSNFIYGFPIIGEIEQAVGCPREDKLKPPPHIEGIWAVDSSRFQLRARASGALHAQTLWGASVKQVGKNRLGHPPPIDQTGNVATYVKNGYVAAFRFGVGQIDKLRSLDDLKYPHNEFILSGTDPTKVCRMGPLNPDWHRHQRYKQTMELP